MKSPSSRGTSKLRLTWPIALLLFCVTPSACNLMFQVEENVEANRLIGTLNFTDQDIQSISPDYCSDYIHFVGHELRTTVKLDREEIVSHTDGDDTLTCNVLTSASSVQIQLKVLDENDNVPRFSELEPVHTLNITENFNIPNPILRLETEDGDNGNNGTVDFYISGGNEQNFFYIGPPIDYLYSDRNELFFNRTVDHEQHQSFNVTITAHDNGIPPLYFDQIVYIKIIDVNDENPEFIITTYNFIVLENHPLGPQNPFGNVSALDRDFGSSVIVYSYRAPSPDEAFDYVALNSSTGELYLEQSIDFETDTTLQQIHFTIQVQEVGRVELDCARVYIEIHDANDDSPEISSKETFHVVENAPSSSRFKFTVSDTDGIGPYVVELQPPVSYNIIIVPSYRTFFFLTINQTLDREMVENITLSFTVYDKGTPPFHTTKTVHIIISDENDNYPTFTQSAYNEVLGEDTPLGKIVTTVEAIDPDFGENGTVSYAITSVNPPVAQLWFHIDPLTGNIKLNATLDYSLAEKVSLVVTASDNGPAQDNRSNHMTTNTTVDISILPAVTFKPRSYQEHCHPNFNIQGTSKIYLEFRTSEKNGLLLYEETAQHEVFTLEIENSRLKYRLAATGQHSSEGTFEAIDVSTNDWISVLYDSDQKHIEAWYTEQEERQGERTAILQTSQVVRCDISMQPTDQTFYVGGIDLFSDLDNFTGINDFVGVIKNLIFDSTQVDLSSPIRKENTERGIVLSNECEASDMTCSGPHYTGCLDYDTESHCICAGGFSTETCKEQKNYAPIQLASSSMLQLELDDYSLFYDLELRSGLVNADTNRRRRRSPIATTASYQLVEFEFRLLKYSMGILLYSKTDSSIHTLQINKPSSEYSLLYEVSNTDFTSNQVYLTETLNYEIGELYKVVINITTTDVTVSFDGVEKQAGWSNDVAPFIQYPKTLISLGGTDDPKITTTSNFTGCITHLSVNGIEFPLNGLLENDDPSVKIAGGNDSSGASVSTTCDLCLQEPSPCPGTSKCASYIHDYECECPRGQIFDKDECISPPKPTSTAIPTTGPLNPTQNPQSSIPLYYIVAGAVVVVGLVIVLLVGIVVLMYCKRHRRQAKNQTYHVGGDQQLPQLGNGERSRPNSYANVTRRPSLSNSEPGYITAPRHNRESSMSTTTYNEHDIDEDIESGSNTQNMTRSKSSTSGETGFHTASERDERSIPRMDDSGNEKETDYSPFDSESDDTESQSYIPAGSPAGIHLGNRNKGRGLTLQPFSSPSQSSGPISSLGAPLTPKEKKFITPLRPDSRVELDEETDLDTDFSSTVVSKTSFPRTYRGSLKLPRRPDNGPQWYKASTSSDTERERKRAEGNRAYYPPHFQSFRLPRAKSVSPSEHNGASRVIPLTRKSSSPINPPHLQASRPKRLVQTDSPCISPLTTYNHHTLPSRAHQKERDARKTSESSEFSTPVLSRSQPLKMHHPFFRQSSSDSPRVPAHLASRPYMPSYIRSYSEESSRKGEKKFVDLGSVRTDCDPIQYWEGQRRMMATVDQVDSYQVLSESFTPFDDSAAETFSMNESQQSGPEHQSFSSQGGGEGTAEALDVDLLQLRDCDTDSVATGTTLKGSETESKIMHFPSADCSDEYRHTPQMSLTVGTSNTSSLIRHSCSIPSQGTFEV